VAWNVVTSLNDSEAANFGQGPHPDHDMRYDRADEFMEVVLGHWDSWEDDALVCDRAQGLFAHPEKVHRLEHHGAWFHSRGPFTVPRSPQGRPVIMQAGHSGRGRRFAARWGELIFVIVPSPDFGRDVRRAVHEDAARYGRDPQHLRILPAAYCVIGETLPAAQEKAAYIEQLAHPMDALVLLSEVLNLDFAPYGLDVPLSDTDLAAISGSRAIQDRVIRLSGKRNPTTRDFITHSGRGTLHELPLFVGTPQQVADGLEEWFTSEACDGFVLAATHIPGAYEDFVRLVVPELQRRGLFHREYAGVTLRENIGLPRPQRGDWAYSKADVV
jgi:FMN-dependent oxidoreductase (nitrilotriacetate monooxygenase family)